jgi:hypothetical protein
MKNRRGDKLFGTRFTSSVFVVVFGFLAMTLTHAVCAGGWTRGIADIGTRPADQYVFESLELVLITGQDDHVSGLLLYHNAKPALITIDGAETPDGEFHPDVVLEVGQSKNGKWQIVESLSKQGKKSTITVQGQQASKSLIVKLDAFRPMIGKLKYGRIVLKTGEAVIFELGKLSPPNQ